MTVAEIVEELEANGNQSIKNVLIKHGAKEPFFGVKIEYLKKIQKRIKMDTPLALELYATGISDAMYLAGLIAEDTKLTRENLNLWAEQAHWSMIAENTVAWVASGNEAGYELAREWIKSDSEMTACAGWSALSCIASLTPDEKLDIECYRTLLETVGASIHQAPNRVRFCMNSFIIHSGVYVSALTEEALQTAKTVGKVSVSMGQTSCKVSDAAEAILKAQERGEIGKKLKKVKC